MIIRRRHTANFTTIGNALFEDERLAADEVGILAFLLSRPDHWEVRRPALMRRWKVGPDTIKRVMRNLIRCGWCRAEKVRLPNGTFHIIYEIRDEPGPELTEDEVRGALSLVSSEAASDESDATAADAHHPGPDPSPPPSQPGVANQGVARPPWPEKNLENPDSERTEPTKGARAFADVKAAWPPDHVLSLSDCEALHLALTDPSKEAAYQGIRTYLADCAAKNRKICDLATYYRGRRWEPLAQQRGPAPRFVVTRGTPQAARWRDYFAQNEPAKLGLFDQLLLHGSGYTVASEWPPRKDASAA